MKNASHFLLALALGALLVLGGTYVWNDGSLGPPNTVVATQPGGGVVGLVMPTQQIVDSSAQMAENQVLSLLTGLNSCRRGRNLPDATRVEFNADAQTAQGEIFQDLTACSGGTGKYSGTGGGTAPAAVAQETPVPTLAPTSIPLPVKVYGVGNAQEWKDAAANLITSSPNVAIPAELFTTEVIARGVSSEVGSILWLIPNNQTTTIELTFIFGGGVRLTDITPALIPSVSDETVTLISYTDLATGRKIEVFVPKELVLTAEVTPCLTRHLSLKDAPDPQLIPPLLGRPSNDLARAAFVDAYNSVATDELMRSVLQGATGFYRTLSDHYDSVLAIANKAQNDTLLVNVTSGAVLTEADPVRRDQLLKSGYSTIRLQLVATDPTTWDLTKTCTGESMETH